MDIALATASPIVVNAGDTQLKFQRLTMGDLGALVAELREQRRAALLKNLKDAEASEATRIDRLESFEDEAFGLNKATLWAFTIEGARRTLLESLRKSNKTAMASDVDDLGLSPNDAVTIALELWGFKRRAGDEGKDQAAMVKPTGR